MPSSVTLRLVATLAVTLGLAPGGIAGAALPSKAAVATAAAAGQVGVAADVRGGTSKLPPDLHPLATSAVDPSDVWLVGRPSYDASPAIIEHWDGIQWHRFPLPHLPNSTVSDVAAVAADDVWAVGRFKADRILHWDGTAWRRVSVPGMPLSAKLVSVAAAGPANVWAVGQRDIGSRWRSFAVHWDGTSWSVVPTWRPPADVHTDYEAVSVAGPDDAWVSGFRYDMSTGVGQSIVDHWNGVRWKRLRGLEDVFSEGVTDLTAVSPTEVWVVGSMSVAFGEVPMAEHWDGSTWTLEATPTPGINSGIDRISAVSSSDVWAVGWIFSRRRHPTTIEPLALHWDGTAWSQVALPGGRAPRDLVTGVSADSATDAWMCGASGSHPLLRHWDGTTWS